MKTVRMLVILVVAMMGLAGVARSQTSTYVYGADDPEVDVDVVQDAVDNYDIVYLQGTFDLGDKRVRIKRSVEILGEGTDAHGQYLTRIEGGMWGALCANFDPDVEWAVRDIEFDGGSCPILTRDSKRFEVTGCSISLSSTDVGRGILLVSNGVTGSATIKDNYIDLSGVASWGWGVFCQSVLADIEVVDNTVENFLTSGLWVNSAGNIEITDNTIIAGPAGSTPYRNGILVGSWFLPPGDRGNIEVTDNTITTSGHQRDNGIVAEDAEPEDRAVCMVEDNVITYINDSPFGRGILLINQSSNWTFEDNTINGGGHDLLAGIFVDLACDLNCLLDNKLGDITGDGIILKGDYNIVSDNKFDNISGQHIVDESLDNFIEDNN